MFHVVYGPETTIHGASCDGCGIGLPPRASAYTAAHLALHRMYSITKDNRRLLRCYDCCEQFGNASFREDVLRRGLFGLRGIVRRLPTVRRAFSNLIGHAVDVLGVDDATLDDHILAAGYDRLLDELRREWGPAMDQAFDDTVRTDSHKFLTRGL